MAVAGRLAEPRDSGAPPAELLYVGSRTGPERELADRSSITFRALDVAGGLRGMGISALGNALALVRGFGQAMGIMRGWRPDAILATGGYVCAPVVLAGWLARVPSLIYLPDTEPGWAIRFLAPFAAKVAITVDESARFFGKGKSVVTGYPVRADLAAHGRFEGRARFGVSEHDRLLLAAGGSRGARHINGAISEVLPDLLTLAHLIHCSGQAEYDNLTERARTLPDALRARYHLHAYLHEMPLAMAAADLAISRSGASVLGEYPAVGLPSILVPYAGGHRDQELNANYLAEHGAAMVIPDGELTGRALLSAVRNLLGDDQRLASMSKAASGLARPGAADRLAEQLQLLAHRGFSHTDGD